MMIDDQLLPGYEVMILDLNVRGVITAVIVASRILVEYDVRYWVGGEQHVARVYRNQIAPVVD